MNNQLVKQISDTQVRSDIPSFTSGDTIKIGIRITEGGKERKQDFLGVVIARKGSGVSESFIVRKMSGSIGVERNFFVNSPSIISIEVIKVGKVRRAKINYLRGLKGKAARIKEVLVKK